MKKYNVLITGVGAIIGYGLINSLKKLDLDLRIVGMDIYNDAYGKNICDIFIQSILASDPEYPIFLRNVIKKYNIDLVMFGTEQEIYRLLKERDNITDYYDKLVINNENIIELSEDKWLTHKFLSENGFPVIPSSIDCEFEYAKKKFGIPFLLKPRCSYASKGIEKINNVNDFNYYKAKVGKQFMVQKIVGDNEHEYTVAVFGFGDGTSVTPIVLKRKLSGEGATVKAEIIVDNRINKFVNQLTKILKPIGPTNYQFRKHNDEFLLLEINPRISSSTSLRAAFGYNEAEMCLKYFVDGEKFENPEIKKGKAVRYIADCVNFL